MTPASKSAATSICASVANKTANADGGIIIASPPVPKIGPMLMYDLYPRRDISGTIKEPNKAVDPIDEPDSVENAVPPRTVT